VIDLSAFNAIEAMLALWKC